MAYNDNRLADDDDENAPEKKAYGYYETTLASKIHHFYISDYIGDPGLYIDMIQRIKTAGPNDVIYIYLNTPGGQIGTGVQLISAMNISQAHIVTVLEGEVCSLGTLIFLSGDEFIVHDHCLFMIHNFSGGTYGKGHEQAAQLEGTIRWFTKLAHNVYVPFLSEDELERVIRGEDLWMDSDEVRDRLTKMVKIIEKERKQAEKEEKERAAVQKKPRARRATDKKEP